MGVMEGMSSSGEVRGLIDVSRCRISIGDGGEKRCEGVRISERKWRQGGPTGRSP